MEVLWIATKVPVPPVDGGRLVQLLTLRALAQRGVRVTLLAPVLPGEDDQALAAESRAFCEPVLVPVRPPARWRSLLPLIGIPGAGSLPASLARHAHRPLRRRADQLLASGRFSVTHAEQLHALPQAAGAEARGVPVVLRAQNVESDLWSAAAERFPAPVRILARRQARRLARWEGAAVGRVSRVVALTEPDANRLAALASGVGRLAVSPDVIPAPFPGVLPPGEERLAGDPAVVVLGSGGWLPNRDSREWMVEEVWPVVRRRRPEARLHVFGGGTRERTGGPGTGDGVVRHPAPRDVARAFARGSILVVPLRIASGVRMKILEAWARGLAVVATPEAAAGLKAEHGKDLLVADGPEGIATAVVRLADVPALYARLVEGGRRALAAHHAPERVAQRLEEVYRQVRERPQAPRSAR